MVAQTDYFSPESWEEARRIGALIGKPPSIFSGCIRLLLADHRDSGNDLREVTLGCLSTLLKSLTFRSILYHAALTYRPERLEWVNSFDARSAAKLFSPEELAHLVAIVYLYRKIRHGCPEQEFQNIIKLINLHGDIGGLVGDTIPAFGFHRGLVVGTIRHLAMAMFLGIDEQKFVKYRRDNKIAKRAFDLERELQTWRCTHIQVGALLLQNFGLGVDLPAALLKSLLPSRLSEDQLGEDGLRIKLLSVWIDSMAGHGSIPDIVHQGQYYPRAAALEKLLTRTALVRSQGTICGWLEKKGKDISAENSPLLFAESAPQPSSGGQNEEFSEQELTQFAQEELG